MRKGKKLWHLLNMFMVAMLCVGLSSCGPDDDNDPVLQVTGNPNVELSADGASILAGVTITTENTDWSVTSNDGWLHATKNGQTVMVSADKNPNTTNRKGTITISATKDSKLTSLLYVTQEGEAPYIKVNGLESNSVEFMGGFEGKSGIDYKQTVTITSNVNWNVTSVPSWLSVSPSNGNGTVQMTIYPTSENTSSSERTTTIMLSGDGANAKIEITQRTTILTDVKVTPTNLVALYNQLGWELVETGKVNKFHWLCISENEINRMTDKELLEALLKEESNKYVDDYMFFPAYDSNRNRITQNTSYYICTVAFNVNDERGEVVKTKVTTPTYLDADKDAWVSFPSDEMMYGKGGFQFTAVKEGFCDTYHVIYGNLPSDYTYPAVAFAFEMNYYAKYRRKHWLADIWEMEINTYYPNNHTFTYSTSTLSTRPLITIFAWGVFKDGKESSDINGGQWDISENNSPQRVSRSAEKSKNIILKRSVEEKRAKNAFNK